MPFEIFDRSKSVYGRSPNVTIQARGIFSINQAAYRRMGEPRYVYLMYDPDQRLIGIQGTTDDQGGHKVRVADQAGAAAVISGTAFTKYYDIDTTESLRWEPRFDGDVLIVDLKVPGRPIGSRRTRPQDAGGPDGEEYDDGDE